MNTKSPILNYFKNHLADYSFVEERRPILIFRKSPQNGIFQFLALQRDSKSHALSPNLGCTYDFTWGGESGSPLGRDGGFPNLRLKSRITPAIDHWHFYKPNPEGLLKTLNEIKSDFDKLAPDFFESSRAQLRSDSLLQFALTQITHFTAVDLADLEESNKAAGYLLAKTSHPAFLRLKNMLESTWTPETSEWQRQRTNRIAYDCLLLRKKQLAQ